MVKIILLLLLSLSAFSQNVDTLNTQRWINFNQVVDPYLSSNPAWNKKYITEGNDTIENIFKYHFTVDTGPILYEFTKMHDKLNGLCIGFYPNGKIYSVVYYLDNKYWETISLADSTGKLFDPGTLSNGSGTISSITQDGKYLGYRTYINGNLEGKLYSIGYDGSVVKEGELKYLPKRVKYDTLFGVQYVNQNKDTVAFISINNIALDSTPNPYDKNGLAKFKIIKKIESSSIRPAEENEFIHEFLDQGVFPVGIWKWYGIKFEFDNEGKILSRTSYNDDGSIKEYFKY